MAEFLTKEKVLEFKGEVFEFNAPELEGTIPLRAIGFRDLMEVQKIEDDVERAIAFIRLGIPDPETGEPMFGEKEFEHVANHWPVSLIKRLADRLRELSGADEETRTTIEGNSEETTKGDSPIS